MTIDSTTTVRDVAINTPQATGVFEKLKIDYCCGGSKPLTEACASVGVKVDDVITMIEQAKQSDIARNDVVDFQQSSLTDLIAHILDKHHVYTKNEMTRLDSLISKVLSVHGENHPELRMIDKLFRQLCADLTPHMFKEEQILFPYILELERATLQGRSAPFAPFGTVNNPIRMMMAEHDTAGEILHELRAQTRDYTLPADACMSYQTLYQAMEAFEKDLYQHIHLENNILFPRALTAEQNL